MRAQNKAMTWAGWGITGLVGLLMAFSGIMALRKPPEFVEQFKTKFGYPDDLLVAIGIIEIACAALYVVPQTAVLGAVLLTGYLGGAVATHVRVHDNFVFPVIVGVLVWLGVYLRDPRIRALLPIWRTERP
jgi:DoxX-like family